MTFRNPWIDPRVTQVRAAAARSYLVRQLWKPLPPHGSLEAFEAPNGEEVVQVPLLESGRDYVQRLIELITTVALVEGRYAVAVLDDMLCQPSEGAPTNGPTTNRPVEQGVG